MAVYSYSNPGPIAFSTFDTWANNVSSDVNSGIDNALIDWFPTQSAPYSTSILSGAKIFYGNVVAGTGGSVGLSAPYSVGSTPSFGVKNLNLNVYSLTLIASTTYPYTFHSWRTADNGGGTQLSTSSTYTLTGTTATSVTTFYAYFTTTHSNTATAPTSYNYYFVRGCAGTQFANQDRVVKTTSTFTNINTPSATSVTIYGSKFFAYSTTTEAQYLANAGDLPSVDVTGYTLSTGC